MSQTKISFLNMTHTNESAIFGKRKFGDAGEGANRSNGDKELVRGTFLTSFQIL
ncbi:MAG: hypothetical protein NPIRA04_10630 [Nitrospirales bacterium]|nr:MAG: hypothetical protein NPIRA04_10630 [Nitrospirales bacterium]